MSICGILRLRICASNCATALLSYAGRSSMKKRTGTLGICVSITSKGMLSRSSSFSLSMMIATLKTDFHPLWKKSSEVTYDYEVVPEALQLLAVVARCLHLEHAREQRDEVRRAVVARVDRFVLPKGVK